VPAVEASVLAVTVQKADGKPLPGAVVTIHALDAPAHPAAPVHAAMDQVDLAFEPDLLVIPVGSTMVFPNTDTTSHQVYSFLAAAQIPAAAVSRQDSAARALRSKPDS